MSNRAPSDPLQADPTQARRESLLRQGWPTSADVGRRAGDLSDNPAQWAKEQRDAGRLLGGWDSAIGTFRYPPFQFDSEGRVRTEMPKLLQALAEHPDRTFESDVDGWSRIYWLYQPFRSLSRQSLLSAARPLEPRMSPEATFAELESRLNPALPGDARARTPAEIFAENAEAVIALAHLSARKARPDRDAEGQPSPCLE